MTRPPSKGSGTPLVVRGPQVGDHLIRLVEPVGVRSGKWRGTPKEWTIQFRMENGHMLYVSLASEADLVRLGGFVANALERAGFQPSASEPWDPETTTCPTGEPLFDRAPKIDVLRLTVYHR